MEHPAKTRRAPSGRLADAARHRSAVLFGCALLGSLITCARPGNTLPSDPTDTIEERRTSVDSNDHGVGGDLATFGMGCFWCSEAIFSAMDGVERVVSGYAGGDVVDPTYEQVCAGTTGHAEVVQVHFNSARISYPELLEVFWATHDPTTLNRQGNDIGTQYRSVIFYHGEEQRRQAELSKQAAQEAGLHPGPIVTEIRPFTTFYPAAGYHQDYFARNPDKPYCNLVIAPKVAKFRKLFRDRLAPANR